MKKYLRVSLVLIAILTVYSIIVFIVANNTKEKVPETPTNTGENNSNGNNNGNKEENPNKEEKPNNVSLLGDYNIILAPNTIISYKDKKWIENKNLNYSNILFDVYVDMELLGNKYLTYNNNWLIYDENRNFYDYNGELFAINTKKEYKLRNFAYNNLNNNDKNEIISVLTSLNISYNYEDINKYKISYDINRDGVREDIFFISNAFTENESFYNNSFSVGFVKLENETNIFYKDIDDISANYSICNPYLQNILEFDNNLYFITGCAYFSNMGTEHYVYSVNDNKVKQELKTSINE